MGHNIGSSLGTRDIGAIPAVASSGGSITATGVVAGLIGTALAVAAVAVTASASSTGLIGSASLTAVQAVVSTGSANGLSGSASSTSTQTLTLAASASGPVATTSVISTQTTSGVASGSSPAGSAASTSSQTIPGVASGQGSMGSSTSASTQTSSATAGASGPTGSGSTVALQTLTALGAGVGSAGTADASGGHLATDIDATASVSGLSGSASSASTQTITSSATVSGSTGSASVAVTFPTLSGDGDASGPIGSATSVSTQAITASSVSTGPVGSSSSSLSQALSGAGAANGSAGSSSSSSTQILTSTGIVSGPMGSADSSSIRTINAVVATSGPIASASATAVLSNPGIRDNVGSIQGLDNAMWADAQAYASSNGLRADRSSTGAFNPHQSDCIVWSFEPRERNRLTRGKIEHEGVATATVFVHAGKGPVQALTYAEGLKDALRGRIYGEGESMAEVRIDPLDRQGASFTVSVVIPWKLCQSYISGGQITQPLQHQPDMVECYTEIRKAWRDYVQPSLTGVSTYFDNAPSEEISMPFCMNMISTFAPIAIEMGTLRTEGRIISALHFPPGTGFSALWDAVNVVVEAFDSKTYGNIKFKTPVIGRAGRSDINSWQANVRLPFHFEVNDL